MAELNQKKICHLRYTNGVTFSDVLLKEAFSKFGASTWCQISEKPALLTPPLCLIEQDLQGWRKSTSAFFKTFLEKRTCCLDTALLFWDTSSILEKHCSLDIAFVPFS